MKFEESVKITPQQLLADFGIEYIEKTNRLALCCPFHHDTDPSAGFYTDTNLFHCFACELTIGILDFYARYKDLTRQQAEQELIRTYGGVPEKREIDWFKSNTERIKAEAKLKERRGKDQRLHAALGEALDFVMWCFDRGHLSNDQLVPALNFWYGLLDANLPRQSEQRGIAGDSPDDGVKERLRDVPGPGCENPKQSLEAIRTEVADRLCAITGKELPPRKVSGEGVDDEPGGPLRSKPRNNEAGSVDLA